MKIMNLFVVAVTLAAFLVMPSELRAKELEQKLQRFLEVGEELRELLNVPGVGITIVYENKVAYSGGLGFSDLKNQTPVSENTLFSIGSNTKAFTGVVAAKLVSKGKLKWDTPLIAYIPELKLKEEYVTRHVTLADALAHRVGLKRSRTVWKYKTIPREELLAKLKDIEFTAPFRSGFHYSNLMYMVAGVAMERQSGSSWEELIAEEIFQPLGMSASYATSEEFLNHENRAVGYHNDGIRPGRVVDLTSIAPAGAISSTPKDIGVWLEMLMNDGEHDGKPFLSKSEYDYLLRPHSHLSIRNEDELWFYYAGLGGFSKNGKRTLGANGAIDGQNSRCVLEMEDGFAIFIMTNQVSEYKELLAQYAKQIFVDNDLSRDIAKEQNLAGEAGFQRFLTRLLDEGRDAATLEYERLTVKPAEVSMDDAGHQLITGRKLEDALLTFQLNAKSYPKSASAHESLAKAYLKSKDVLRAKEHCQKAISLDSTRESARSLMLEIEKATK